MSELLELRQALLAAALLLFLSACEVSPGGSSTDTGNGLHGQTRDAEGNPLSDVELKLRPRSFIPGLDAPAPEAEATSRADGAFQIAAPDTGDFVLEAVRSNGQVLVLRDIRIEDTAKAVDLGTLLPQDTTRLHGRVRSQSGTKLLRARVFLHGTERIVTADTMGYYDLGGLPKRMDLLGVSFFLPAVVDTDSKNTPQSGAPDTTDSKAEIPTRDSSGHTVGDSTVFSDGALNLYSEPVVVTPTSVPRSLKGFPSVSLPDSCRIHYQAGDLAQDLAVDSTSVDEYELVVQDIELKEGCPLP